jgi:hypothetical protein
LVSYYVFFQKQLNRLERTNNMKIVSSKYWNWIYYYYYIFAFYVVLLFFNNLRIGVFASVLMLFFYFYNIKRNKLFTYDICIILFVIWNLFSIIFFSFSDLPISVYIREFSNTVLPIGFYFIGKTFYDQRDIFYKNSAIVFVLILLVGLFLFYKQPEFYRVYLNELEGIGLHILSSTGEFRSLVGLTMTGSIGFILSVFSSKKIIESRSLLWISIYILSIISTFLTFRRSAMVVVSIQVFIFFLFYLKNNIFNALKYFLFSLIFLFLIILILNNYFDFNLLIDLFVERLGLISEGINERKGSWYSSFIVSNWFIGDGLGVYGHKAVEYSDVFIPDGYYFRLIAELGVIGFGLFSSLLIISLIKSLLNIRLFYIEFSVILGLSLQAIGSNIFSFQLVAPLFWFMCGIVLGVSKSKYDNRWLIQK